MAVTVSWMDSEHPTLLFHFSGRWTWDEFYAAAQQANELAESRYDPLVHSVLDFTDGPHAPPNSLAQLPRIAALPGLDRRGSSVVVGAKGMTRQIVEIFSRLYSRLSYAETVEDAKVLISDSASEG